MFKNLKSLFIVEEEGAKANASAPAQKQESAPKTNPETSPKTTEPVKSEPGKASPELTEVLLKALEVNNLDGFDYLEFKQSLNSLKKMPMDEQTRYQSAFAMAQTMGVSVERLLQTGQHYLDVLKQEEQKFQAAVNNQKSKHIGEKEQSIQQLEANVKAKAEQIKQLTAEIEADQASALKLKQEISDATVKVENTKNDFMASYQMLVQQISGDLTNIKNFLK